MRDRPCARVRGRSPARLLVPLVLCTCATLLADGLPGEYLLSKRWRGLHARYSPLPNPSLLTEANYFAVRGVLARTFNEFNKLELGVTVPIGLYQTAAFTWLSLGTAPYESIDAWAAAGPEVNANDNFFMLSYAVNPWRRLSIGVNINLAHQNLFGEESRVGFGVDAGLSYRVLDHPALGNHLVGLAMANLVPPSFGAVEGNTTDLTDERQAASLELSLNSTYWEKRLESGIEFTLEDLYAQAEEFQAAGGGSEGAKTLEWALSIRLGAWILRMVNAYGLVGFEQTGFEYGGFGLGFNLPSVNAGRDLSFVYQLVAMNEGDAISHTMYLRGDFGKHREELYARRMARLVNIEPNDLYNRALQLYSAGRYWDAFFLFGRIVVEYPDFFKRDWVDYYMASCQEHMDMRRAATNGYVTTKRDFPRSTVTPYADLGLMRVFYRDGDYASVAMQFNRLNTPDTPDSLKAHGYYLMAQSSMKTGEFRKARQLFELIPATHPEHLFAQHSLAVLSVTTNDMDAAIDNLRLCVNAIPRDRAQEEVINRSLVLLGYLFYELSGSEGALSQAVTALRNVPKASYYYEDALLGLGWTAIRARQWQDAVEAGNLLVSTSQRVPLRAEGALVHAYALMMRKNYAAATTLLARAMEELTAYAAPTEADMQAETKRYETTRVDYNEVATSAQQLAENRQSDHVLGLIDSLHDRQQQVKTSIDQHLEFFDEFGRNSFFARNIDKIIEDVEYALAVSQKLGGVEQSIEVRRDVQEKQEEIDEEIERLQKEMEKLEGDSKKDKKEPQAPKPIEEKSEEPKERGTGE